MMMSDVIDDKNNNDDSSDSSDSSDSNDGYRFSAERMWIVTTWNPFLLRREMDRKLSMFSLLCYSYL